MVDVDVDIDVGVSSLTMKLLVNDPFLLGFQRQRKAMMRARPTVSTSINANVNFHHNKPRTKTW